jgi:hypothetical protein
MGTAATVIILCVCQRINYWYASSDPALETHIRRGGAYSTLSLDIYLEGHDTLGPLPCILSDS